MSGPPPEVHTGPPPSSAMVLDKRREEMTRALTMRDGFDLAKLDEEQFEEELRLNRIRTERVEQIIKNDCIQDVDYGKVPGIEKPFAFEGAADKIARRLRWSALTEGAPSLAYIGEALVATVTVVIRDNAGHPLLAMTRSCSSREKRFKLKRGGWKYAVPEEAVNELVSMAFKRGRVAGVLSAAGVKHLFSNPDQFRDDEEVAKEVVQEAPPLTTETALNYPYKGHTLAEVRTKTLGQIAEACLNRLAEDEDQPETLRLLEAVKLVQIARDAGAAPEPPPKPRAAAKESAEPGESREPGVD